MMLIPPLLSCFSVSTDTVRRGGQLALPWFTSGPVPSPGESAPIGVSGRLAGRAKARGREAPYMEQSTLHLGSSKGILLILTLKDFVPNSPQENRLSIKHLARDANRIIYWVESKIRSS